MSIVQKTANSQSSNMEEGDGKVDKNNFLLSTDVEAEYIALLKKDEDGRIVATCPTLQGAVADGVDEKEAITNIRDAIDAVLEDMNDEKKFNIISHHI